MAMCWEPLEKPQRHLDHVADLCPNGCAWGQRRELQRQPVHEDKEEDDPRGQMSCHGQPVPTSEWWTVQPQERSWCSLDVVSPHTFACWVSPGFWTSSVVPCKGGRDNQLALQKELFKKGSLLVAGLSMHQAETDCFSCCQRGIGIDQVPYQVVLKYSVANLPSFFPPLLHSGDGSMISYLGTLEARHMKYYHREG